jgi:hypothetical protein
MKNFGIPKMGPIEQAVKVCYVDNCCNVKSIVRKCFPGTQIKLDAFHWLNILVEPNLEQAGVFRAMMSKALFNISQDEYERAKARLELKKKREVSAKEIRKEACSEIPNAGILRSNVVAVLQYFQAKDAQTEFYLATRQVGDEAACPKQFLKPSWGKIRDRIKEQLKHIDKGCLSDPPVTLVNLHRYNAKKDVVFIARGTNSNERDNVDLSSKILSATHVGLHRAERLITGFFEIRNHNKAITRLGEYDHGTYQTERLLNLNSYAIAVGFTKAPYDRVSCPTVSTGDTVETMGFEYKMATENVLVSNPTNAYRASLEYDIDNAELNEDGGDDSEIPPAAFGQDPVLQRILEESCAELDIEVVVDNADYLANEESEIANKNNE